ncbi:hypothetical protein KIN20_024812 [Parelaphostrongylus tenuis]|uniref:Uncharacterized protein n=1 Tax=Parelaphostrongylus tenuis TaxID=148309 RepID=A0AAD5QXN8_PARTN|nr:hypothetical protein KIN20_024812 [Parelaphostrongylus tenuis]
MPGCGVPEDVVVDLQKELRNDKFELREKLSKIRSTLFASKARLDEFEERVQPLHHVVWCRDNLTQKFRATENVVVRVD